MDNEIRINLKTARPTVINWPNQLRQIVDGYRSYHCIAHGIQKDAIQNAWDARMDKNCAVDWGIEFELAESFQGKYLIFRDQGTSGLTGRVLLSEDLELDLPIEERWGRFENVAFTKAASEKSLGARGRGKFIFLGGSNYHGKSDEGKDITNLILYDTFRSDNVYRMGYRTLTTTDSLIEAFEGESGHSEIKRLTKGLIRPLNKIGTRVIIVNPLDEITKDIQNGNFKKYIEETWWEIIKEFNAKITIKVGNKKYLAKLQDFHKFPQVDSKDHLVWIRRNIKLPGAPNYRIRNIHIVYNTAASLPEDIRGISIQRGGMKICAIPVKYIDKSIADSIYGYINFDEELEQKLREDEGPEHYSFDFKRIIPRLVRQYVDDEINKFAREKLGLEMGRKQRTYEKTQSAEMKAIYQINKIAIEFGITGKGLASAKKNDEIDHAALRPIRLKLGPLHFPSDISRVDYGQSIKPIELGLINDTKESQTVGVRFSIIAEDLNEVMIMADNLELRIKPQSKMEVIKQDALKITKEIFRFKGKYSFVGKLVALNNYNRGEILHQITRSFWVEENPPQKGIFEDIEAIEFPKEKQSIMGISFITERGGYIFSYNSLHPAKKAVEQDENSFMKYLIKLMCIELAWIDLRGANSKIFSSKDKDDPTEIVRVLSRFLGEVEFRIN